MVRAKSAAVLPSNTLDKYTRSYARFASHDNYKQLNINVHTSQWVEGIDRTAKIVTTLTGEQYPYDKLILATGSFPFVPPIKGNDQPHCLVYRTLEDL